jgi:hypothetical protein
MSAPRERGSLSTSSATRQYDGDHNALVHPMQLQTYIVGVTDHDVLSGRGVNIAQHAGNERFRALIFSRHDVNYCHAYTTAEKRALAEEIVGHIKSLDPPGRFLRRSGRPNRSVRGLDGPWEELSKEEAIKKTCQALRDCNRQDRTGYAASVSIPEDVSASKQARSNLGLTNKQLAERAAAEVKRRDESRDMTLVAACPDLGQSHPSVMACSYNPQLEPTPIGETTSNSASLLWLMKQDTAESSIMYSTPMPIGTPTTSGSSGGYSSLPMESRNGDSSQSHNMHHHRSIDEYSPVTTNAMAELLATHHDSSNNVSNDPHGSSTNNEDDFADCHDDFSTHFEEDDVISHMVHESMDKHSQEHNITVSYHLTEEAAVAESMGDVRPRASDAFHVDDNHRDDDFGLHLHHHDVDDPF